MKFRDYLYECLYTLAILICGTAMSSAGLLINPYRFAAGGGGGGGGETVFVTAATGAVNGDLGGTGQYGYAFTVAGGSQITITHLGVRRNSGAYADFTVKLFSSDGTTELASAVCDYDAVSVGAVSYTSITPVVVAASASGHIRLANIDFNTFDNMGNNPETNLTTTAAASITSESAYVSGVLSTSDGVSAYVDFKYTTP